MNEWLSAGVAPFAGLEWWIVAAVAAIHMFGSFVRGAFGFGSNLPVVLLTTFLLGPHHAIVLALMTTIVAQTQMVPQGLRTADWPVLRTVFVGIVAGTALGTWIFTVLQPETLSLTLGFLIALVVIFDTFKLVEKLTRRVDMRGWPMTTGFSMVGGTLGGISGGGAFYFLVVFLKHACATPTALRGTNLLLSAITMVTRLVGLIVAGMITPTVVTEGALLIPFVVFGTWAGSRAFRRSTPAMFYTTLQILLMAGAIALIFKVSGRL